MTKKNIDKEYQKEIEKSIKMFDVAKPGSSRPASTSRPIIVGHKATINNDPMVNEPSNEKLEKSSEEPKPEAPQKPKAEEPEKVEIKKPKKIAIHHKKNVTPLTEDEPPVKPEPVQESADETPEVVSDDDANAPDELAPEETPEAPDEPEVEEPKPEEAPSEEVKSAVVDAIIDQVSDKKAKEKELADVSIAIEEVQKSISEREFFLPIVTFEQKRNLRLIAGVLLIAILAVGVVFFFGPEREKINSILNLE